MRNHESAGGKYNTVTSHHEICAEGIEHLGDEDYDKILDHDQDNLVEYQKLPDDLYA